MCVCLQNSMRWVMHNVSATHTHTASHGESDSKSAIQRVKHLCRTNHFFAGQENIFKVIKHNCKQFIRNYNNWETIKINGNAHCMASEGTTAHGIFSLFVSNNIQSASGIRSRIVPEKEKNNWISIWYEVCCETGIRLAHHRGFCFGKSKEKLL